MKLYDAMGPHPRVVRMVCAEKGLTLPAAVVSLGAGDAIRAPHLVRNPLGQVPVLTLDTGQHLSETLAICEYLEERAPTPPLLGTTAPDRAEARMWVQRVQLNISQPLYVGWRQGLMTVPLYRSRGPVAMPPGSGAILSHIARAHLDWLEQEMGDRDFLCGDRFTLGDILLYCFLAFAEEVGQLPDPARRNLRAWFDRIAARPAAIASATVDPDPQAISSAV
ncbi:MULTISPECIES: glutathione S-transferase family protein [unclassified Sphingobium]|uniref:glutathione S-transferase family protein n=1 Tax=unclassified Sphingobium TaxID=2611147 RepID=UPI0035A60AF2